jgi:anthranilate/para-aminobenzoate synthase component I
MWEKKVMLKVAITSHLKVDHVSPNRIFSEVKDKNPADFSYFIVLQSITA